MKQTYFFLICAFFTSYMSAQYCTSSANTFNEEYISRVQLNTLDNANPAQPPPSSGYTNFTGLTPTSLARSSSYTLSVTKDWAGTVYAEGIAVWIDYNQNGVFTDSGELVFSSAASTTATVSGAITIPAAATLGNTRMRVKMQYNATPTNPCGTYNYGEVEDYTVNIVAAAIPADIYVSGNTVEIPDGSINTPSGTDHTAFGTATISVGTIVRTFTIRNDGNTGNITMPSNPVSFGGGSDAAFTVTAQPSDLVLSPGETTTFQVTFAPTVVGLVTAEIVIANNDPDVAEQSFTYNINGSGALPTISPAAVSSSLQLWMKANEGTTLTGTDVDSWDDQSTNGFTAVSQGATDAQFINNGLNFNPVLRFSGNQYLSLGNPTALDITPLTEEMTIIAVIVSGGGSTGTVISKSLNTNRNYQVWLGQVDRVMHYTLGRTSSNTAERFGTIYALNEPKITTGIVTNNADPFLRLDPYVNGVADPAFTNNGADNGVSNVDVLIGARRNNNNTDSGYLFSGDIAEIIMYDRPISVAERNRIESYLAIKYGTTLGFNDANWNSSTNTSTPFGYAGTSLNYLDSDGNIIWNGAANAGYGYNVFGVARDDNSALLQTQSSSVNVSPSDVLTIRKESGTFDANLSYLIVGNNGLSETLQSTTLPERTDSMLNKIWIARESAVDVGTVELSFDMSGSGLSNLDDLELYIADDSGFTSYENYPGTNVSGVLTFSGINLENGQYFTLADPEEITGSSGLFLDGVDDYVEDKTPVTAGLTSYTVMAWIKNPGQSVAGSDKEILGVQDQFEFNLSGGLFAYQEGVTGFIARTGTANIRDWSHFAMVVNASTGIARYYLNGDQIGGGGVDPLTPNPNPLRMGTYGVSNFFEGSIDEVKIFNVALTVDQLQQMVYQEVEQNGSNIRGKVIPKDIQDLTTSANVPWSALVAYYDMSSIVGNRIEDISSNDNYAFMKNISALEPQTAPLPFETAGVGNWENDATWLNGSVWSIPSSTTAENWSIVRVRHNITANASYTTLGLLVDSGSTLTVSGTNPQVTSTSPFEITSGTGYGITNTWYSQINGVINLQGDSQFVQQENSDLEVTSSGYIEKDQQGTSNRYTYNYWSSPVSIMNTGANNIDYSLNNILLDGSTPTSPAAITWTSGLDGSAGPPITLSSRWIYKYVNGADEDYTAWQYVQHTGNISPGEGYTMKGVSTLDEKEEQNYVFRGKPNNGTITVGPLGDENLYLVGNPYPSTLNADEFINDNLANNATSGTLYFWEHWGGGSHILTDYQGGYATYTLSGGTPAMSHPDVNQTGSGTKTPKQYIPVAQGFFVQGDNNAGNGTSATVEFNNSQRLFLPEYFGTSPTQFEFATFMRGGDNSTDPGLITNIVSAENDPEAETANESESETENNQNPLELFNVRKDNRKKIRLGYTNPDGFHRQILITFDRRTTDGVDMGFDGKIIDVFDNDIYWTLNNEKYVIQAVEDLYKERVIPIGVKVDSSGAGTIMLDGLENINDNVQIYIKDLYSNTTYNLRNGNFQVNAIEGETNDRYALVFEAESTLSVDDQELNNNITIYNDTETKEIVITNNSGIQLKGIDLHTIIGQQILSIDEGLNETVIRIPAINKASGIYILSIYSEKGKISKKLVLQ